MRQYMQMRFQPEIDDGGPLMMCYRRMLNAVPDEVSPGNVPEPWQPGDFAAHITMVPIEERVRIFHEVMKRNK